MKIKIVEHRCVHCGNVMSPMDEWLGEELIKHHRDSPHADVKGEFVPVSCYRCLVGSMALEWKPEDLARIPA